MRTVLLFGLLFPLFLAAQNRPPSAGQSGTFTHRTYSGQFVGQLNRAEQHLRGGDFELALIAYDAALAERPNWLPAVLGKVATLQRVGRNKEAQTYLSQASRIDPVSAGFFLSRESDRLLTYLALYPDDWMARYRDDFTNFTRERSEDFFNRQLAEIKNLPDSNRVYEALRLKIAGQRQAAYTSLRNEEEDRTLDPALVNLVRGNLLLLDNDRLGAIASYTRALEGNIAVAPEIRYNRGLAYILNNNYQDGCEDLRQSSAGGFEPAGAMLGGLCDF